MTAHAGPSPTHSLVLERLAADLDREQSRPEDALRRKIVLTTLDVMLSESVKQRDWAHHQDQIVERLRSIGLDECTSAAWTHELLRAAGAGADDLSRDNRRHRTGGRVLGRLKDALQIGSSA